MKERNEYILQVSSGRGPEECWRVVAKVLEVVLKEARAENLEVEVVESIPGYMKGTLLSAQILLKGKTVSSFIKTWEGSILWISKSPYRKFHKRKNWFVGVTAFDVSKITEWKDSDVKYETLRASGPGGQHVNKTESAVRAKHIPSWIAVVASERRSQFQNKIEALARLKGKVQQWYVEQATAKVQDQWQQHNTLERGNAVRVFEEKL